MRVTRRHILVLTASVIVLAVLGMFGIAALVLSGLRRADTPPAPVVFDVDGAAYEARLVRKPDRALALEVVERSSGHVAIRSTTSANTFMRYFVVEDHGVVWFYNDAGLWVFRREPDGAWVERAWIRGESAREFPVPDEVLDRLSERMRAELGAYRKAGPVDQNK